MGHVIISLFEIILISKIKTFFILERSAFNG